MIDYDCGPIVEGVPLPTISEGLFERVIETASGDYKVKADRLEQYDFFTVETFTRFINYLE